MQKVKLKGHSVPKLVKTNRWSQLHYLPWLRGQQTSVTEHAEWGRLEGLISNSDADTHCRFTASLCWHSTDCLSTIFHTHTATYINKKHLKNVGPIRHCEPLHCHSPGVATVARRHCHTPPAHRCPQRRRRQQRQRQRVTEGTAMAP